MFYRKAVALANESPMVAESAGLTAHRVSDMICADSRVRQEVFMPVPNSPENAIRCHCVRCPTFDAGARPLFCATGKSPLRVVRAGCLCDECPVFEECGLDSDYYCIQGKAE